MKKIIKRKINKIVLHCSDSDHAHHDDISVIDLWHKNRGWKGVGYHYFIKKDGTVQHGRGEAEVGAHVKGHNSDSIGICFSGSKDFTEAQFAAGKRLVLEVMKRHNLSIIDILAHNQLDAKKTCPNFPISKITKDLYDA